MYFVGQHDNKEKARPTLLQLRRLGEAQRKKPMGAGSCTYKYQRYELGCLSNMKPPPLVEK